ncbi:MAG: winged helix DNA-binding domain-containing protein [Actinomycetota bacterium]|nr:winged helix DNA-binding domain-containing protein [Actinomycetota bacterium]
MAGSLTIGEARRLALRAQGLLGAGTRPAGPAAVLRRVAALQLDTIGVLARSHELVCYSRVGPVGRAAVDAACWGTDDHGQAMAFEYWAHAGSILPIETWPWFAFRRRQFRDGHRWGNIATDHDLAWVLDRLAKGPITATELGGARKGGPWWDWSPRKVAAERLLDLGQVVCTTRRGWRRVYDLVDRGLPPAVRALGEPPDDACHRHLIESAGRCLGVGTAADLADYFRMPRTLVAQVLADTNLVPVNVDGWNLAAWADPLALDALPARGRHRSTLLSPFDSLIWDRARTERLFGFAHRLEPYTPKARRIHGYYAMPLLAGGRLIGRVDPKRAGHTLVARQVSLVEPVSDQQVAALADALTEAAEWVGCDAVTVEAATPAALGPAVGRLL